MKQITSITNDPNQILSIVLDDGTKVNMNLNFWPAQLGWYYSLSYGDFIVNNRRMVNSPNMLRQFRTIIPFGLCCTVLDGYEILYQDDFTSGRVSLYALNANDVIETETLITLTLPNFVGYPLTS